MTAVVRSSVTSPPDERIDAPALSVDRLTKRFGARTAYSEVSFQVAHGEVFGFLGPNGAGKTTTVRTLGTLIAPTSGSATVAGIPLTPENGVEIRQHISIMPEAPGLYLRLTVTENLEYFAGLYGLRHPGTRIKDALEAVNLADRAGDLCGGLSKGLRQRVGLARTLLSDPTIMFLDEPTSGLDPVAAREVHDLIIGLRGKGVTIFLTTHRLEEAEKLCDRVAIMNTTLRTIGRPDELRAQLFKSALIVKTLVPLGDPDQVFTAIAAVDELALRRPGLLRALGLGSESCRTRGDTGPRRRRRRCPVDRRGAAFARGRLPGVDRRRRRGPPTMMGLDARSVPRRRAQGAAGLPAQTGHRRDDVHHAGPVPHRAHPDDLPHPGDQGGFCPGQEARRSPSSTCS